MLFNVQLDEGNRIVGYLVPDSYSDSAALRLTDGQRDLLVLPCDHEMPAIAATGRHTGRCGFIIDETVVADLAKKEALELYDQDTNILIYRRRTPSRIMQKRVFRLETQLVPLWRLDDHLNQYFQHFHKGIERYGLETSTQMFLLYKATSLYLSGRLIFKSYENHIDETFNCVTILRDPYVELAERLLTFRLIRRFPKDFPLLGARDMLAFDPAIEFAERIEIDEKLLRRAFGAMPRRAIASFANPITRQLAARNAEEVSTRGAIATALGTLSRFSIVGVREHQELFLAQLADLLGIAADGLPPMSDFSRTIELSMQLRAVPEVSVLIEQDLEVYSHVRQAIEAALSD